jgi:hypothetical protein
MDYQPNRIADVSRAASGGSCGLPFSLFHFGGYGASLNQLHKVALLEKYPLPAEFDKPNFAIEHPRPNRGWLEPQKARGLADGQEPTIQSSWIINRHFSPRFPSCS